MSVGEGFDIAKFFEMLQFEVTDGYRTFSTVFYILLGCLCAGLVIAAMVKLKKSYALSIIAAVTLIFGTACISLCIVTFNSLELFQMVSGSNYNDVADAASKVFLETMMKSLPLSFGGFAMFLGWLFGLIVMILNRKNVVKGLGIAAIVLHIVRYVLITPYPFTLDVIAGGATEQIQMISDFLYGFVYVLPFIFYALGAFLKREKNVTEAPAAPATPETTEAKPEN